MVFCFLGGGPRPLVRHLGVQFWFSTGVSAPSMAQWDTGPAAVAGLVQG